MIGKNAIILLSGGLDSAINLALAARAGIARKAITIGYGQKAETAELRAGEALSRHYRVEWEALQLPWLGKVAANALTRAEQSLPHLGRENLDNLVAAQASAQAVWVANRNGLFINAAAVFAEALRLDTILVGFNREEAATFPDNSLAYMQAATEALRFSTSTGVRVDSYSVDWDKSGIMQMAIEVGLPLDLLWYCYLGGDEPCGVCESCLRFTRAYKNATGNLP